MEAGLKEGLEQGQQKGASAVLSKLLQRKFGALPVAVEERLKTATPAQLETWSLNVLDATALDDVFNV